MTDTTTLAHAVSHTMATPDGPFTMIVDAGQRVLASGWTGDVDRVVARISPAHRPLTLSPGVPEAAQRVEAYYAGELAAIDDVPVQQHGGDFFLTAWRALRAIPAGAPLTYTALAAAVGKPTAVRAAAGACASNAPALFVPCHRVVRTDGTLGGFAWGIDVKRSLLDREAGLLN